jgi:hypothetical protein
MQQKRCTKCGKVKPLSEFHNHARRRDGKSSQCKLCHCAEAARYRAENAEKVRKSKRRYYEAHKQEILEQSRARYRLNRQRVLRLAAEYREKNRERINEWHRQYRQENLEKRRKKDRVSYRKHRETRQISARARKRDPNVRMQTRIRNRTRRARAAELPRNYTAEDWNHALDYWDHRCAVCGRPQGLWHSIVMDHWIPLSDPNCPGTIPTNILPLCHGIEGCNNNKSNEDPIAWLRRRLGNKRAESKRLEIQRFFDSLR